MNGPSLSFTITSGEDFTPGKLINTSSDFNSSASFFEIKKLLLSVITFSFSKV